MDGRVRFGLIGCGDMGLRHLKAYIDMSRNGVDLVELKAVCDVRIERAKALASIIREELGLSVSVYDNFLDMCDYADIDAVDIVVPPLYHHSLAISCLGKGKHALVEKPFGITVRSCWRMIEAAKENNRLVAVAENYRRTYHSRALFSLLSQNIIGDVYFAFKTGITALGNRVWIKVLDRQPSTWRHDRLKMGAYAIEYGSHDADLLRYWFGEVDEIYGVVKTLEKSRYMLVDGRCDEIQAHADDTDFAIIKFESGVVCQWSMSTAGHGEGYNQLVIYGSRGCIKRLGYVLDDGTRKLDDEVINDFVSNLDSKKREKLFPFGTVRHGEFDTDGSDPLKYGVAVEIYDFADSIVNKRKPEVDGMDGLKSVAIGLALMESASINRPLKVSEVEELKVEKYQKEINDKLKII
jgi:predicted dehydrogenase